MFGYFRFNQLYASPQIRNVYKNYYCGTCFALEYNYGEIARCILSYDVVILALIAKIDKNPNRKPSPCFFYNSGKKQYKNVCWEKIAAINVLLMNAKLDDDINDEKSAKAKLAAGVFHKTIEKAEKRFPVCAQIIKNGYKEMYKLECNNAHILEICEMFANMMSELIVNAFDVDENRIRFVKGISRWLYFIDQLDDYDDDIREGKYNPLYVKGLSKSEIINKNNKDLFKVLKDIFRDYDEIKCKLDLSCSEDCLLYAVISESIPSVTNSVLMGKKLPKINHCAKHTSWKEVE